MNRLYDVLDLAGRILIGALFVWDGWLALGNYAGTQGYVEQYGVPGALLPLALATQLGGGILVIIGLWTRLAALALAGFCLFTAFVFHAFRPDIMEQIQFWKDVGLAGGFLVLLAHGAGAISADARLFGARPKG